MELPKEVAEGERAFVKRVLYPVLLGQRPAEDVTPELIASWYARAAEAAELKADAIKQKKLPFHSEVIISTPEGWLLTGALRRARPDLLIGVQCHLPIPEPEQFVDIEECVKVLRSLNKADHIGVHVGTSAQNLAACYAELTEAKVGQTDDGFVVKDFRRRTTVQSIEVATDAAYFHGLETDPKVAELKSRFVAEHGLADKTIDLMIGACEPNKGPDFLLEMWSQLLENGEKNPENDRLVMVVPPRRSGAGFPEHSEYAKYVKGLAAAINKKSTAEGKPASVLLIEEPASSEMSCALHQLADTFYMPSVAEGNSFVAQEGPACGSNAVQVVCRDSAYYAQYGANTVGVDIRGAALAAAGDRPLRVWPPDEEVRSRVGAELVAAYRVAAAIPQSRRQAMAGALRQTLHQTSQWGPIFLTRLRRANLKNRSMLRSARSPIVGWGTRPTPVRSAHSRHRRRVRIPALPAGGDKSHVGNRVSRAVPTIS